MKIASMVTLGLAALGPAAWAAGWLPAAGAVLPLQDRVGDPAVAAVVDEVLRAELGRDHSLIDRSRLRDALRRRRIRDVNQAPPELLDQLGRDLEVEWFFAATLHEVGRQRPVARRTAESRAVEYAATEDLTPGSSVPQVTLSARLYRVGAGGELAWAGFVSASGLDGRRLLGLGVVNDLGTLVRDAARQLTDQLAAGPTGSLIPPRSTQPTGPPTRRRVTAARTGFRRAPLAVDALGPVAVVPFHGIAEPDPTGAAEMVTELALAVLHQQGVRLVFPGRVNDVLRQQGVVRRGAVDAATREALHRQGPAEKILTGTVETWEVRGGGGAEPEPRVAFSARLLDATSGRILWLDGQDRGGWDRQGLLRSGRIYAAGNLAEEIMRELVAGLFAPASRRDRRPARPGAEGGSR